MNLGKVCENRLLISASIVVCDTIVRRNSRLESIVCAVLIDELFL